MRRINTKRLTVLLLGALALYIVVRSVNFQDRRLTSSWFFEYVGPTPRPPLPKSSAAVAGSLSFQQNIPIDPEEASDHASNVVSYKERMAPFEDLLQLRKCPMCFGTDLCHRIQNGAFELDLSQTVVSPTYPRKVLYEGTYQKAHSVLAKSLMPSEFGLLDQHICRSVNEKDDCDVAEAAHKMVKLEENIVSLHRVQRLHAVMKKTSSDIPLAICASDKLIDELKKSYDDDRDGHTSEQELIFLYASLASNPELAVLKFLTKAMPSLPFPQYYGACGRVFVLEGAITPLSKFLSQPFHVRASLGAQLLQMVEDFMTDEDSDWFVMFTEFSFDNLGVNKGGEVVILDVEDMIFVDKTYLKSQAESLESLNKTHSHEPCNEQCLRMFTQQVMHSSDPSQSCASVPHYGHLMYAAVCQRILSYLDEHHADTFFNTESRKTLRNSSQRGLLHSPPNKDRTSVEELLQECVQESAAGGRIQAAEELRDYLAEFIQDDVEDDEGEQENDANEYDISDNSRKQT